MTIEEFKALYKHLQNASYSLGGDLSGLYHFESKEQEKQWEDVLSGIDLLLEKMDVLNETLDTSALDVKKPTPKILALSDYNPYEGNISERLWKCMRAGCVPDMFAGESITNEFKCWCDKVIPPENIISAGYFDQKCGDEYVQVLATCPICNETYEASIWGGLNSKQDAVQLLIDEHEQYEKSN